MKIKSIVTTVLVTLAVIMYCSTQSFATHSMGGDITYRSLGNNTYLLTLKFYRDCNGIPAPVTASELRFNYSSPSCGINLTASFLPIPDSTKVITPICMAEPDLCITNQGTFGIERYMYEYVLDLSAYPNCGGDWEIEWDHCCRNTAITSLQNPGSQQIYLRTTIDNTITALNNNSPRFINDPTPFACVNQPMVYNHGVADIDGDSLIFSLAPVRTYQGTIIPFASGYSLADPVISSTGVQIDPFTGTISFTPSVVQVAVVSVLVEEYRNGVKINELIRDVQFSVVNCANNIPVVSGFDSTSQYTIDACAGDSICFTFHGFDADVNDSVKLSWNGGIQGATFSTTNGIDQQAVATLCWVPKNKDIGPNLFSITARDNACPLNGLSRVGYLIQVLPSEPASLNANFSVCSDSVITVSGNYPRGTIDRMWRILDGVFDTAVINDSTLELSNLSPGSISLEWTLMYGSCGTTKDTLNISVFDANLFVDAGPDQLDLCLPVTETSLQATGDSALMGYWSVVSGTATFENINDPTTTVSDLDPDTVNILQWNIDNGPCGLTSDQLVITFQSNCINEPPDVTDTTVVTIPEDSMVTVCIPYVDANGDSVFVEQVIQFPGNGVFYDSSNCITYIPDTNWNGTDTIIVTICDSAIFSMCDTAVIIIIVTPVNDKPVAIDDYVSTERDSTLVYNILNNDYDIDGDDLTATILSGPSNGTATVDPDGTLSYTPDTFFTGYDTILYSACDNGSPQLCDTAFVIINVYPMIFPPTPVDSNGNEIDTLYVDVDEDSILHLCFTVLYNGMDSASISNASFPSNGIIQVDTFGLCITYIPDTNYFGFDTTVIVFCNQDSDPLCDTLYVFITVNPVNDPPFAHDDSLNMPSNTTGIVNVLLNDNDIDGDTLSISIVGGPDHGSAVTDADGNIYYTPDSNFSGFDTIMYEVCDNGTPVLCDTAFVYIIVGGPIIVDTNGVPIDTIFVTIPEDSFVYICLNVIYFGDDSLIVIPVSPPANGILYIDTGLCFSYVPDTNFNGVDTVIVTICEDTDKPVCDTVVVIITVTPVNDKPVAVDDYIDIVRDTSNVIIHVLANDYDPDGDSLNVSIVVDPQHGSAVVNEDNTISYLPDSGYCGPDSFVYIACDSFLCDSAVVYINVDCNNDPPLAVNDTVNTLEDSTVMILVLNNDFDPQQNIDTAGITIINGPTNGSATVDPVTGVVTYIPDPNYYGADSFTYVICDNGYPVFCDTATVYINVLPVNDPPLANDDYATVDVAASVNVEPLNNDTDIDGNLLWENFTIISGPAHGSYSTNNSGVITYTPGAVQNDTIVYVICDDGYPLPEECDTAMIIFEVVFIDCYIPQGFSPNNDGVNDLFVIPCLEEYPNAEFYVYNRWGDEVWGSDGPYLNNWWDGRNRKGDQIPSGNYFFILDLKEAGRDIISNYVVVMQ